MPRQLLVTLPEEASPADLAAVEAILRKSLPQAAILVTFMASGMSLDQQARIRSILPRARVSQVPLPGAAS